MNQDLILNKFKKFVLFFNEQFRNRELFEKVPCKDSYKKYVFKYYRRSFGAKIDLLPSHHIKWFQKLRPVLALPQKSIVLDYGGGYGMDSIFLASCGYHVIFFERTPYHIAICEHLKLLWEKKIGTLNLNTCLSGSRTKELNSSIDAIISNEVAHHIEPVTSFFDECRGMLKADGELFLMEPNFFSPVVQLFFFRNRGFNTVIKKIDKKSGKEYFVGNENIRTSFLWRTIAAQRGFKLMQEHFICAYGLGEKNYPGSRVRSFIQTSMLKYLFASHIVFHFKKDDLGFNGTKL